MKYIIKYAFISLALLTASCDNISENDRYIKVEATKAERTVLLEDFTGQNCVNCPAAHRTIEALEQQYGSHLIAVSIHAGHFGIPADNKRYTGLMQPEGRIYNDRYGIEDYPSGIIDGKIPVLNPDQWATAVYDDLSVKTPLMIDIHADLDRDTNLISIDCSLSTSESLGGKLIVWIIESGIVARQEDINEGRIHDYIHNNVFRACVNGVDGNNVTVQPGSSLDLNYSIPLKDTSTEKWIPENLAVVAFLSDASGVVQAAKVPVSTSDNH